MQDKRPELLPTQKKELLKRDSSDAGFISKASVMDQATKASLKRSLAQLDADARAPARTIALGARRGSRRRRELVDFTVWNFTAFAKITKKRDKRRPCGNARHVLGRS